MKKTFIKLFFLLSFLQIFLNNSQSQDIAQADTILLKKILQYKPELFGNILKNASNYRLQIIYTQIKHNKDSSIRLKHFTYRYKPDEYFYPASIVKLPLSLFALEKLNKLNIEGLNKDTHLSIDSNYTCQTKIQNDFTSSDSLPSISDFIRRVLVVSDNEAYNRLYEFMGQKEINKRWVELGYNKARIVHRFNICSTPENKYTNAFTFFDQNKKTIYRQEPVYNENNFAQPLNNMAVGEKNKLGNDILNGPKDFSYANCMPLDYIHSILIKLIFPSFEDPENKISINEDDRDFILKLLLYTPRETGVTAYQNEIIYWDTFLNYLYYGSDKKAVIEKDLKIYNIVGQSYGFSIDCAYFSDKTNHIEFFLSAIIYTNATGIINSDNYEYLTVAMPFMKNLGRYIYNYEKGKKSTNNKHP